MKVVDVDAVLDGVPAEFGGSAIGESAYDAAAREPHLEPEGMMSAAVGAAMSNAEASRCGSEASPIMPNAFAQCRSTWRRLTMQSAICVFTIPSASRSVVLSSTQVFFCGA